VNLLAFFVGVTFSSQWITFPSFYINQKWILSIMAVHSKSLTPSHLHAHSMPLTTTVNLQARLLLQPLCSKWVDFTPCHVQQSQTHFVNSNKIIFNTLHTVFGLAIPPLQQPLDYQHG